MDLSFSPAMHLKIVFVIHLVLSAWGTQGYWSPDSYFFYNLILLLTLIWSMHAKDNAEPLQIAITINLLSIILDIIVLATYFPSTTASSERFSAGMAIMNLVARPISIVVMSRNVSQRSGLDTDNFSNIFGGNAPSGSRSRYEDIDNAPRT